jgi:hypothetical protein
MGQPVTVIEKPSAVAGVVRFETNRPLTGMGHEIYRSVDDAVADRPADLVARVVFEHGGIQSVHVNANVITVALAPGGNAAGLKERLEELFIYYREGVEVVMPEGVGAD